jgi:hypothetical protein
MGQRSRLGATWLLIMRAGEMPCFWACPWSGMAVVNQAHAGVGLGPNGLPSAHLRAPLARLPLAAWGL